MNTLTSTGKRNNSAFQRTATQQKERKRWAAQRKAVAQTQQHQAPQFQFSFGGSQTTCSISQSTPIASNERALPENAVPVTSSPIPEAPEELPPPTFYISAEQSTASSSTTPSVPFFAPHQQAAHGQLEEESMSIEPPEFAWTPPGSFTTTSDGKRYYHSFDRPAAEADYHALRLLAMHLAITNEGILYDIFTVDNSVLVPQYNTPPLESLPPDLFEIVLVLNDMENLANFFGANVHLTVSRIDFARSRVMHSWARRMMSGDCPMDNC